MNGLFKGFYSGKRIFLTGHTGFKGSWMATWLTSMGASVYGYSLDPPTKPSLFEVARVADILTEHTIGDIRDGVSLSSAMQRANPELVIHMAAQPLVRLSYKEPISTYEINVMGTLHLLEAVRKSPSVRAVVVVTTDKVYENREWVYPYRECDHLGGYDPYSSSKACAEIAVASYIRSFFHPERFSEHRCAVATVRAGNVIGGGDWALDRLVPDVVRSFSDNRPVQVRNPQAIRPWQHVLEPLNGYLMLAERLYSDGAAMVGSYNIGPNEEDMRPVGEIVALLAEEWKRIVGRGGDIVIAQASEHPHEAGLLKLDASLVHTKIGWRPKWNLKTSLAKIVEWHRSYHVGEDMQLITLKQIEDYQS